MSMTVYFYQFDKKVNSTKLPTLSTGDIGLTVELKDATNLFTPRLVLAASNFMSGGAIKNPMKFTYAYIPDFSRYYFITTWGWINGRWECSLKVDVLASFKTQIGTTTAYVLRSASAYNASIPDTRLTAKAGRLVRSSTATNPWKYNMSSSALADGFFVVGIGNADSAAIGSVSYYMFTGQVMRDFMSVLMGTPAWMNVSDPSFSTDLQKALTNPLQYVISCVWIPLPFSSTTPTAITSIKYGWWTITGITAYRLDSSLLMMTKNVAQFTKPTNPYKNGVLQEWMDYSPWTECFVECSPFGTVSIDPSVLTNSSDGKIYVNIDVDCITGRGQLRITVKDSANNYVFVCGTNGQVGVQVPVAQMSVNYDAITNPTTWIKTAAVSAPKVWSTLRSDITGMWNNLTSGRALLSGTSFDTSSGAVSKLKEVVSDIGDGLSMATGTCSMQGSAGGFAAFLHPPMFISYFTDATPIDQAAAGLPYCAKVQINTLSGFILCSEADAFTAPCMAAERQEVLSHMEGGFYYE